jgi:glycerol uptake facilitator-like aquaporin
VQTGLSVRLPYIGPSAYYVNFALVPRHRATSQAKKYSASLLTFGLGYGILILVKCNGNIPGKEENPASSLAIALHHAGRTAGR